jgi:hypothetical protein
MRVRRLRRPEEERGKILNACAESKTDGWHIDVSGRWNLVEPLLLSSSVSATS